MAHNTKVVADHAAPPVTRTLAEFVAAHPSGGWDAATEHEAHRSVLNWLGCAIGAARHETIAAALAAVQELDARKRKPASSGAANASTSPRRRSSTASARTRSTSTIRICGRSSTRPGRSLRPRWRWPSTSGASGPPIRRCRGAWHRRRMPRGQRHLSRPLRSRLAYHGIDGNARRSRSLRPRPLARRAANDDGAGYRSIAADRRARAVRHHDQVLSHRRRGARGAHGGADGTARIHRFERAPSKLRAA